ncbi:hypothetical protein QN397_19780 [Variovorax sp. RTB1]|uniref:A1S_2505 family phage non-structural protein n=1 Tax=Variovorax sp. RTB1 TaxID=3048631 RepID=UPI002B23D0F5|nr:hypothetical protein [Variovorax sp. RTB1]MEB0113552.1 hypothetical protein [Variovorax sp. RTB1]
MKFHVDHTSPPLSPGRGTIFVFGSNTAGRHGMDAALYAAKHMGAERYVGHGRTGDAIAIPTEGGGRTGPLWTLPLAEIAPLVKSFVSYAATHPELDFLVTRIGCGLAGYADGGFPERGAATVIDTELLLAKAYRCVQADSRRVMVGRGGSGL